ncbi:unnamed protein product, partial [Mycena citricolor]
KCSSSMIFTCFIATCPDSGKVVSMRLLECEKHRSTAFRSSLKPSNSLAACVTRAEMQNWASTLECFSSDSTDWEIIEALYSSQTSD